jgi:uncharacterized protein (DUF1810 family)
MPATTSRQIQFDLVTSDSRFVRVAGLDHATAALALQLMECRRHHVVREISAKFGRRSDCIWGAMDDCRRDNKMEVKE